MFRSLYCDVKRKDSKFDFKRRKKRGRSWMLGAESLMMELNAHFEQYEKSNSSFDFNKI